MRDFYYLNMMIENNKMPPQNEILAMDSAEPEEELPAPYYVEGLEEIPALHCPPIGSTRPYALNYIENKWEFFDTVEERDEFVKNLEKDPRIKSMEYAKKWMAQQLPKIAAYRRKRREEERKKQKKSPVVKKEEIKVEQKSPMFLPRFVHRIMSYIDPAR